MAEVMAATPYQRIGGEAGIRRLVKIFYDLVERAEVVDGCLTVRSGSQVFALGPRGAGVEAA